jgi:hypothetical protein
MAAAPLLLALAIAGCGGSSSSSGNNQPSPQTATQSYTYDPAKAHVPACAHAAKAIAFPANFPQNFPVPNGTVIDATRVPIGGGIAAVGFVPSPSFKTTVDFFPAQIKAAGFKMLHLEVDSPNDSEGEYSGHGFVGGWALRSLCPGAMTLQISAKKAGH